MKNIYYYLILVTNEEEINFLSNKQLIDRKTLVQLDELTTAYDDVNDLVSDISPHHNLSGLKFTSAIIISEREFKRLQANNWSKDNIKVEPVLFKSGLEFVTSQQTHEEEREIYNTKLIEEYKNQLLINRGKISTSLVRYVRLGIEITPSITPKNLDMLFHAYYKNKNYKIMRQTYLELKKLKGATSNFTRSISDVKEKSISKKLIKRKNEE